MAYRSKTEQFTAASSFTITVPTGVVDGDFIVFAAVSDGNDVSCGVPTGFTKLYDINSTADGTCFTVGYKIAASEGASWSYTTAGGITVICAVWAYSGRNGVSPLETSSQNSSSVLNASPWTVNATGVTTTTNGDDLIWVVDHDQNVLTGPGTTTPPAGYTLRSDGGAAGRWLALADFNQSTAGATGTVSGTGTHVGASAGWCVALLALKPAAGGGGSTPRTLMLGVG